MTSLEEQIHVAFVDEIYRIYQNELDKAMLTFRSNLGKRMKELTANIAINISEIKNFQFGRPIMEVRLILPESKIEVEEKK